MFLNTVVWIQENIAVIQDWNQIFDQNTEPIIIWLRREGNPGIYRREVAEVSWRPPFETLELKSPELNLHFVQQLPASKFCADSVCEKVKKMDWKFNIPLSLRLPLMCTPGVSHSACTMGSEAYVAVTITSAPLTHSSLLSNALAHGPSSAHNAWALSNVLFHTRTCWNVLAYM